MKRKLQIAAVVSVCVACLPIVRYSYAQSPTPVAEQGSKIGTIISSAITTALPEIRTLATAIATIFGKNPNTDQKKLIDEAVQTAKTDVETKIKANVTKIKPLGVQLNALVPFLQYGFRATLELQSLIEFLGAHPTPTDQEWPLINAQWKKVEKALGTITADSRDIDKQIINSSLKEILQGIVEAKTVTGGAISALVDSRSNANNQLQKELNVLAQALSTLHLASRNQVAEMAIEVSILTDWASNAASASPSGSGVEIKEDMAVARAVLKQASKAN